MRRELDVKTLIVVSGGDAPGYRAFKRVVSAVIRPRRCRRNPALQALALMMNRQDGLQSALPKEQHGHVRQPFFEELGSLEFISATSLFCLFCNPVLSIAASLCRRVLS